MATGNEYLSSGHEFSSEKTDQERLVPWILCYNEISG